MAKALSPAQQGEYDRLRSFLGTLFDTLLAGKLPSEAHPIRILDRTASQSPSRALRGLREAVNDMVEATQHANGRDLALLEERLSAAGAPTLRAMRARRAQAILKILDRGIESDEEWRIINGAIADQEDRVLVGASRDIANDLLGRYEARK